LRSDTHARKAINYDIGRPEYPREFFDWLYSALRPEVIADIGCGPGKIMQGFARRGSKIYAVEPDPDMFAIAQNRLEQFENCVLLHNTAEETGIPSNSIDLIFCGNSYMWFDRPKAIAEFERILRPGGKNIIIARQTCDSYIEDEYFEARQKLKKPLKVQPNIAPPFREGKYITKEFRYVIYETFEQSLSVSLSTPDSPDPEDSCYDEYCRCAKLYFDKHSHNGKLKTTMLVACQIGSVNDLI